MGGIGVMCISPVQLSPSQKKACANKEMVTKPRTAAWGGKELL